MTLHRSCNASLCTRMTRAASTEMRAKCKATVLTGPLVITHVTPERHVANTIVPLSVRTTSSNE